MKTFKTYIEEERKGGEEKNPHISIMRALEKYQGDENIFITYTKILKVGLNPRTIFSTPAGVYAYPLNEVWKLYANKRTGSFEVPWAGNMPYVSVLKRKGKHIDDIGVSYSSADYSKDIKTLYKYCIEKLQSVKFENDTNNYKINKDLLIYEFLKVVFKQASKEAYSNTIGGQFWNITRFASLLLGSISTVIIVPSGEIYFRFGSFNGEGNKYTLKTKNFDLTQEVNFGDSSINFKPEKKNIEFDKYDSLTTIGIWAKLWVALGYNSVADRSNNGIIHEAEKTQAVFFSPKGYDVLDTFLNKETKVKPGDNEVEQIYFTRELSTCPTDLKTKMNWNDAKMNAAKIGKGWKLPNTEEAELLYLNKSDSGIKNFKDSGYYWTSEKGTDPSTAKAIKMTSGEVITLPKNYGCWVRPVVVD